MRNEPSSLTKKKGWDKKFPKFKRAGEFLGSLELKIDKKLKIYNGLHDSNSSLYFYRSLGFKSFTLISTGTWVVIFNTDTSCIRSERDMLCNITVDNKPIATARFMGGRL